MYWFFVINGEIAKIDINVDFDLKIRVLDTGCMVSDHENEPIRAQNCVYLLPNTSIETAGLSYMAIQTGNCCRRDSIANEAYDIRRGKQPWILFSYSYAMVCWQLSIGICISNV